MKKLLLFILLILLTSCVPDPEVLAGVTKEELVTGKAVEKCLSVNEPEKIDTSSQQQTLAEAHEKEIVDVAEHTWDDIREQSSARVLEDGAIECGVGESFKVSVK
ncbi:hypothetical protein GF358_01100 [Candidatus Woesearchaeota archaeon]|nr:hypothetical protein [Candidatus Woesearchaeota archaeon]